MALLCKPLFTVTCLLKGAPKSIRGTLFVATGILSSWRSKPFAATSPSFLAWAWVTQTLPQGASGWQLPLVGMPTTLHAEQIGNLLDALRAA